MGDVVVAKLAGFCFGVSRAVESVEKTIDGGRKSILSESSYIILRL